MIGPVPALAIAAFVERHDAVSSADILLHFDIGESTLRRRRPALRRLGIEFVENGRWSFYARADLLARLPATRLPLTDRDAPLRTPPHTQRARACAGDAVHDRTVSARVRAGAREAEARTRPRHDRGTTEAPSPAHSVTTPSPQRPAATELHSIPLKAAPEHAQSSPRAGAPEKEEEPAMDAGPELTPEGEAARKLGPGSYLLEARARGYGPRRVDVDVSSRGEAVDLGDVLDD